jgi:beta-lactamase regulating signal transducer with metallopeptidase domain
VLLTATAILTAAILAQRFFARSPAIKRSILLVALITVTLSPLMLPMSRPLGLPTRIAVLHLQPLETDLTPPPSTPIQQSKKTIAPHRFPLAQVLLILWAAGLLIGLARLLRGAQIAARIRRAAKPLPAQRAGIFHTQLAQALGKAPPEVFLSDQAVVPVTIGLTRPAVFLPPAAWDQLDDNQLAQILLHESAHALQRDTLVGLLQELIAALWWFHPLVYWANKLLDEAREAVCDNYVLQTTSPAEYSRTLLSVAQSIPSWPNPRLAPALVRSSHRLENRIAQLLNPRRSIMTKPGSKKFALIATAFLGGAFVLTCLAAQPAAHHAADQELNNPLPHEVRFATGKTDFKTGDSITITDVRGTSSTFAEGNIYQVTGAYKLVSQNQATLGAFITVDQAKDNVSAPVMRTQRMIVTKGEGHFSLLFYMWEPGDPHVSFYPTPRGNSFAGIYFGNPPSSK